MGYGLSIIDVQDIHPIVCESFFDIGYFILAVIYLFSFPPISGANNSDFEFPVRKTNGHNFV